MIGLLVLALMAWNFYIGYRRGLFMQAYYVVSVIIAMCVAAYFYKSLGEAINLWVPYTNPTKDASVAFFYRPEYLLTWPCLLCGRRLLRHLLCGLLWFAFSWDFLPFCENWAPWSDTVQSDRRCFGFLGKSGTFDDVGEYPCDRSHKQYSNGLVI